MSLSESINFIVTVIHYINRMVSLADASYLLDKADRLSPAAEKKRTNGPSFVKQMPCMEKQTPSKLMLIRWRLGHLDIGMKLKG